MVKYSVKTKNCITGTTGDSPSGSAANARPFRFVFPCFRFGFGKAGRVLVRGAQRRACSRQAHAPQSLLQIYFNGLKLGLNLFGA